MLLPALDGEFFSEVIRGVDAFLDVDAIFTAVGESSGDAAGPIVATTDGRFATNDSMAIGALSA